MHPQTSLLFRSRGEFVEAVLTAIASTRKSLVLVDRDFSDWPIATSEGIEVLRTFLLGSPDAGIRVIVGNPDWLEREAPRFMHLRRQFASAIDCRRMPERLQVDDGGVIGDRRHAARRAHHDFFRGRLTLNDPGVVEPLAARLDDLWDESAPCLPVTTLGL